MIRLLNEREKSFVENRIKAYTDEIQTHIIECVIYAEDIYHRKHWIDELSAWFDIINSYELDKRRKLKADRYKKLVFSGFGANETDALVDIKDYKYRNKRTRQYPDFEITNEMVKNLYNIYILISKKYSVIFSTPKNGKDVNDFKDMLSDDFTSILRN